MAIFNYQARDKTGTLVAGEEQADTRSLAINKLREKGLFPIKIEQVKQKTKGIKKLSLRFNDKELAFFTRRLSNLLDSGINLTRALSLLANQTKNQNVKEIIVKIYQEVSEGGYFWKALAKYPETFSRMYVNMVKAAELGGSLEQVFRNLADFAEQKREIKDTLISLLIYPLIVLLTGVGTVFFLMTFVIPKMLFIFSNIQQSLPLATKILIATSLFLSKYWWLLFFLLIAMGFFLKRFYGQEKKRLIIDRLLYRLPLIGEMLQKITFSRFSYITSLLLSNGLSILDCLDISGDLVSNRVIRNKLQDVRMQVSQGSSLSASMIQVNLFPQDMTDMISVGEETGHLDQELLKISAIYDKETKEEIKRILNLLEPALIFLVALVVGFLVMAMLLPLFQFNLQVQ